MATAAPTETKLERIEGKLDKAQAGAIVVTSAAGGTSFSSMAEVMEFAKLMSLSDVVVPAHLRGNPGACMAVCLQAIEWRMSPFAVANKSYVVNDRISYESQLIHAVIEQRAPLVGRLRHRFVGEGQKRQCIVWAFVQGEAEPFEYTSPEFAYILPKNSPLWKTKPDLQLFYNTSRDWARVYFPEVILGVYSDDELPSQPGVGLNRRSERSEIPMPRAIGDTQSEVNPLNHNAETLPDRDPTPPEHDEHNQKPEPHERIDSAGIAALEKVAAQQGTLHSWRKTVKELYKCSPAELTPAQAADELQRLEACLANA